MRYRDAYNYLTSFTDFERVPGLHADIENDGLERVRLLLRLLGRPQRGFKSIIVAGTNGKGSVAAMLDAVLRQAGYNTGLFTSPHLHTYRERIRVGGEMITTEDVVRLVDKMRPVVERIGFLEDPTLMPTTYELTAALAFLYFQERKVDIAVLEVGLGGRLDAVNVCDPLVSVITSISLDHTQVLGKTVGQIAYEKAGIIKQKGHVVTAPQEPQAMGQINMVAAERQAQVSVVGREIYISTDQLPEIVFDDGGVPLYQVFNVRSEADGEMPRTKMRLTTPLFGSHQQVNATVALATLRLLAKLGFAVEPEAIVEGLLKVQWPGRLEVVHRRSPIVVVDGAHNVDSMAKLNQAMAELFHMRRIIVVLGVSQDKDIAGIVQELCAGANSFLGLAIERVIVTRSRHPRAADPHIVAQEVTAQGVAVEEYGELSSALARAEELAQAGSPDESAGSLVLVTGSLFVVAQAREYYGLAPDLSEES